MYYWPKPIYHALVRLAGKLGRDDLDEMVLDVLKETLRKNGVLKLVEQCIHPESALYISRKIVMCEECGMEFENENEAASSHRSAVENMQKSCTHLSSEGETLWIQDGENIRCTRCASEKPLAKQ